MADVKKMRFACLTKKGCVEVRERDLPALGPRDLLIKQDSCNICTTDYTQFIGLREHQGYPMAGGHEGSGHVVAVGRDVKGFEIGDQVAVMCDSCGYCMDCKSGHESNCAEGNLFTNYSDDGYMGSFGFADYAVLSSRRVMKISQALPPREAGFLEPLATVVRGLKKLRIQPRETVVVIGCGTMGLLNALTLRAYACDVIMTEMMENKISNARALGFDVVDINEEDPIEAVKRKTNGRGADVVIVAVGNSHANHQAVSMIKASDGRISLFAAGYPAPELNIGSNDVHYKRMEIVGTFAADYVDFIEAEKLLSSGAVNVNKLLEEKTFSLEDAQDAFAYAAEPGKYRVSIML